MPFEMLPASPLLAELGITSDLHIARAMILGEGSTSGRH